MKGETQGLEPATLAVPSHEKSTGNSLRSSPFQASSWRTFWNESEQTRLETHTYKYIYCLLARPHRAFQSQCHSNNIKHRKLKTQKNN